MVSVLRFLSKSKEAMKTKGRNGVFGFIMKIVFGNNCHLPYVYVIKSELILGDRITKNLSP
jgi:hypothetical protein